ncbi:CRP-like cAMP-binding protein [Bradyrhizobium sp. i1.8.4]|uniref:Crp/Fnr family transcriptional regulator n=1 Tax=unclassified Bradyrhizobium TaxID=2631580 RepID=UPI003D24410C
MTDRVPAILEVLDCSADRALKQLPGTTRPELQRSLPVRPAKRPFVKNVILARLSIQQLAAIGERLEPVVLKERMVLQEPKRPVEHVYFIESGLVSLRVVAAGSMLETAVIGYRGVVGTSFLWGGHLSTHQSVVIFPGSAHRIRVEDLRRVMKAHPEVRDHLFEYVQALTFQCVQTGLCGVRHHREQRLASWLCLASEAVDTRVLPVTHDYLSSVLGLRRAGVTETLIRFEEQGLIRKMRGVLQIDDRKSLEEKACCCYKLVSGAYAATSARPHSEEQAG